MSDPTLPNRYRGAGTLAYVGGKQSAQVERRKWRADQRKANPRPLSTKVVHPRVLVEMSPRAKPKGRIKP